MKNSKISIIAAFLLSSIILFAYGNSLAYFSDSKKKSSIKVLPPESNISISNFGHALEVKLSINQLNNQLTSSLPANSCVVGYSDQQSNMPFVSFKIDSLLIPGSSLKMITAGIIFSVFNKEDTLDTSIYGQVNNGVIKNAILTTSADPSFVTTDMPDLARPDYLMNKYTHSFSDLALELKKKNVARISKITIDNTWFEVLTSNPEWETKKIQVGALGALLVDEGYEASGVSANPQIYASSKLKEEFAVNGITIDNIAFAAQAPSESDVSTTNLVASIKSATIEKLVSDMLKTSNNIYAEQLLIAAAHRAEGSVTQKSLFEFANKTINSLVKDAGDMKYLNASGFSYNAKTTCEDEIEVVNTLMSKGTDLVALTSKANEDGTLTKRFSDYKGKLQAKTGTLDGVTALIGRIDTISFALLVNGQFSDEQGHIYQEKTVDLLSSFPSVKDLKL